MHPDQQKWDRIYKDKVSSVPQAADVLRLNLHLLPHTGIALDLACGLGGNSLLLAEAGFTVHSWDISPVAIACLIDEAEKRSLTVHAEVKDVLSDVLPVEMFDVIVVSHFLVREMAASIQAALKTEGVLFYQTFCRHKVDEIGPNNPDFLLDKNELLKLFPALAVRVYREEADLGRLEKGWRNQAMLVAQKVYGQK